MINFIGESFDCVPRKWFLYGGLCFVCKFCRRETKQEKDDQDTISGILMMIHCVKLWAFIYASCLTYCLNIKQCTCLYVRCCLVINYYFNANEVLVRNLLNF